jgi:hypothetical protein
MAKYRKKPVVINAWLTRDLMELYAEDDRGNFPTQISTAWLEGKLLFTNTHMLVNTLEGDMRSEPDDYLICGVQGELYPCKPDIFKATYERVDE